VADKLMEAVLEYSSKIQAECINLEVRPSNIPARMLYVKYGFEELGLRKNFYSKPTEDGLIMRKVLWN
jgi:ribosomal-protein-alanine N-acetyltransferase